MRQRSVPLPPSAQLDLMREMKGLIEAVPPQEREIVPAARWPGDVLQAVERGLSPRIFHVSSHGVRKDTWWHDGGDTLLFHRTDGGAALPEREEVVDVLQKCGDGLELLFLNACASVDLARYVANKLPGLKVICWQGRVHDACARCFARAFYNHVGEWPGGDERASRRAVAPVRDRVTECSLGVTEAMSVTPERRSVPGSGGRGGSAGVPGYAGGVKPGLCCLGV